MFDNSGYRAFGTALSDAGGAFGGALMERNRRQSLAELGEYARNQDYAGLSKAAFAMGDERLGLSALAMAQEQKDKQDRRALGAETLAPFIGGGTAQGGVTVNPNPQPMALPGGLPANDEISQYIVQSAKQRGIDPGIALKVYRSEGAGGYAGDKNSSFGPFQLHYGGVAPGGNAVPGLGDEFTKATGLDARNPSTWKQQVDFALEKAKSGGWGPWHGWKGDQWAGIGRGVQVADASGAIPADVFQKPMQPTPVDALNQRKENLMRAIVSARAKGVDEQYVKSLEMLLEDTQAQITRSDKQTAQNKPEFKQFGQDIYKIEGGNIAPVQRVEKSAQEKAPTEGQAKAATYYTENLASHDILNSPEAMAGGTGWHGAYGRSVAAIPGAGPSLTPEDTGKFTQAADNFVGNVVYAKSGASATKAEYDRAYKQYIPTPFDSPALIKQKADARQRWLDQQKVSAGTAYKGEGGKSLSAPSAFDIQKAKEALAAGRSQQEVIDFLRSKGMSADGLF
jgi:hypothetical protein